MGSRKKEHERRVGYSKPCCIRVMVLYIVCYSSGRWQVVGISYCDVRHEDSIKSSSP
jgi:hypothetical protein